MHARGRGRPSNPPSGNFLHPPAAADQDLPTTAATDDDPAGSAQAAAEGRADTPGTGTAHHTGAAPAAVDDAAFRPRHVLVTGGAGFIGSHLVRHLLTTDAEVVVTTLDALTYAGHRSTLAWLLDPDAEDHDPTAAARHRFVHGDVRDAALLARLLAGDAPAAGHADTGHADTGHADTGHADADQGAAGLPPIDAVCHLAAESHVDRSITGPAAFLETNVTGTGVVLDACRAAPNVRRILHVSTDEVYGSVPAPERRTEADAFTPNSPYAASKAAGDLLARAYHQTYGTPVVIVRPSNTYGPHQLPEKLIPRFATSLLEGAQVPVYGDGLQVRDWTHVDDTVRAMHLVLARGELGTAYNAGAGDERTNLELTRALLATLDLDAGRIEHVTDRLGHDRRYAIDSTRIRALGWSPRTPFADGLAATVAWYETHPAWWRPIREQLEAEA